MLVVAVANTKGGVGKTTLAAALGVRACQDFARVGVVDLDPQQSLVDWWKRRGGDGDRPAILEGVDLAPEAVERAEQAGFDLLFLDGPPSHLTVVAEMMEAADLTVIPLRPSMLDLVATSEAVALAIDAKASFLCVINDVGAGEKAVVDAARQFLFNHHVPIADTHIIHRVSHMAGMTRGKTAAEIGKDKKAVDEIEALWSEIKAAALKAAKFKATKLRKRAAAHGQ